MATAWSQDERLFLNLGNERDTQGSGKRYFMRGGVKYALLELLQQENMHGYQMMKALEDQSGGTYKPSAGSIYPTLQMLRDQGFVTAAKVEGKKVFEITDEGRAYLLEEREKEENGQAESGEERPETGLSEEEGGEPVKRNRRLTPKGKELLHLLKAAERAAVADPVKAESLRLLISELSQSLKRIAQDTGQAKGEQP
ncbi:DNA-binding PadR family transcriptional regulator [Paenibacillus phyllosphaerae]|uniref:DNA-binding PadR family transcriptional regulator n=1 Tax=Paenibacillus phyllosphaerae TaxID=274593 RepID=A0A7W5FNL3_9BACL|nr:PadR family transcriptional regulator [Paenibacillus phyllosphaerae]MBB3111430.1 DNA-binding PadR family transcriptional regulator [Paenibacillus phyllosphaerae]